MLRLHCTVQQYDWGKRGSESAVARLAARGDGKAIDETKPYAEYWFGTHPAGHSKLKVASEEVTLQDWLLRNPDALGVPQYSPVAVLPYLLKVLSVAKALSVQAHPDRALAERLHKEFPEHYRDPNHKPEMACALTPFDAMCGFRPAAEIAHNVATVPELRAMIGADLAASLSAAAAGAASHPEAFKAELKRAFHAFMSRPEAFVMSQSTALDFRLSTKPWAASDLSADAVASRLLLQFPNDVGVFSPYLLNTIRLAPGEAIFLGANEPHAYLAGDCVEVMACSDNVVRAGLTPKFKDVDTLCNMLTYNTGLPNVIKGTAVDAHLREYDAPVPEFRLQRVSLTATDGEYALPDPDSAAILVVVQGNVSASVSVASGREQVANAEGVAAPPKKPVPGFISSSQPTTPTAAPAVMHVLEEGQVWLQPADSHVKLVASSDAVIFRAVANTRVAAASSE